MRRGRAPTARRATERVGLQCHLEVGVDQVRGQHHGSVVVISTRGRTDRPGTSRAIARRTDPKGLAASRSPPPPPAAPERGQGRGPRPRRVQRRARRPAGPSPRSPGPRRTAASAGSRATWPHLAGRDVVDHLVRREIPVVELHSRALLHGHLPSTPDGDVRSHRNALDRPAVVQRGAGEAEHPASTCACARASSMIRQRVASAGDRDDAVCSRRAHRPPREVAVTSAARVATPPSAVSTSATSTAHCPASCSDDVGAHPQGSGACRGPVG